MARLIDTPTGGGIVGPFERLVLETFLRELPKIYAVAPNFQLKRSDRDALEYDFVVLAPHAVYVVEAKEWFGRLTGDDSEWLLNGRPKKCPLWLVNTKSKVLKSELGPVGSQVYVSPLLVLPDGTQNHLGGSWAQNVRSLTGSLSYMLDPAKLPKQGDIRAYYGEIEKALQGRWGVRQREERQRIGAYALEETLYADDMSREYIARHALLEVDKTKYRVRTWRLNPSMPADALERQKAVIRRPTEAVSKIGPHPNLLRVLQFDFEDSEFYEVTEWSEYGTLHGYLANAERDPLTLRERLEIAEGVVSALVAVHEHDVIHRNVCPESILIGFDRKPRLTDFDRAYVESKYTVFAASERRPRNMPYVPPELEDITDYEFDTASDMYSLGVLLYQLLSDQVPFSGPEAARQANGKPASLPSQLRGGVDSKLDGLVEQLLQVDDFKARPSAAQALDVLRAVLGLTTGATKAPSTPPPPPQEPLDVGTVLKGTMRIDQRLGQGGFAKVFRVFHYDYQKNFALKILDDDAHTETLLREVRDIWPSLPPHPNIAKPIVLERLDPPERRPYILAEYVDGETLEAYCDGRKHLPWSDVKRIGLELLDALATIHPDSREYDRLYAEAQGRSLTPEQFDALQVAKENAKPGIVHRDIKPANIMLEMPAHRPKLIDFNVAVQASDAHGSAGTPPYMAPDRVSCAAESLDLFSLGVVLYQLVLQRHPYPENVPGRGQPYDPRDIAIDVRISDELAEFLLKAVQTHAVDRFRSAHEMRAALDRVVTIYAPAAPKSVPAGRFPSIDVPPEEAARTNYNPYVTRLLTLYSQARHTNAGTRGLDDIARLTYVRTGLDERLAPAIVSGLYRLVIVSGNAGDGKTAFLQQVENLFEANGAHLSKLPSGNGSGWTFDGVEYETNWDGSQDEREQANDDVLANFLTPFAGSTLGNLSGSAARLIAINEGRLLDFLRHSPHAPRFQGLWTFVHQALGDTAPQPTGALLVNLNWRAVTAGGDKSLVEQQLKKMLGEELWSPCDTCAHRTRCPIKHNVDTLRDAMSGQAARERVRRLFEIVHLRRRAHVTMRDLRSALSWMLLRDQSCEDVARLLARSDAGVTGALADLYYPNAFADVESEAGAHQGRPVPLTTDERAVDRLVRRLREADVGLVNAPSLDRRLDHDPKLAVPWMTFEQRSTHAWSVMEALRRETPAVGDDIALPELLAGRRRYLARWRRWAFFERRDDGWKDMLPYRSTELLERIMHANDDESRERACADLRDKVVDAISLSEGVRNPRLRQQYLALRITRVKDAVLRSFRLFPKLSFKVQVAGALAHREYVEHAPDAVELVAPDGVARLRISLDLLEMLDLIRTGYRPTAADLQGLFVNLLIFRNELLTSTFDRVLVTDDDENLYEISAAGRPDGIRLTLEPHAGLLPREDAP